jgi:hypothetical protein
MFDDAYLKSYATKYRLDSFEDTKNGSLKTFFYLKTRKKFSDRHVEELTISEFYPNANESFKEIQEQIHSLCGDIYFSKNRFGMAIIQYRLCLRYNSGNIHAIVGLANSCQSLGLDNLARKMYDQSKDFYAWEKTFLDKSAAEEQNSNREIPDDAGTNEFQYIPKDLLFNMAITEESPEKSQRMFEHIANSEPSPDLSESFVLIEFDELRNRLPARYTNADIFSKLKNSFSELEKIQTEKQNRFSLDSKIYRFYSKPISSSMIYIAVPENISKSKKISALYFQYSLTEFNDKNLLENIIKQLNINIKNSTKDKTDFLYKEIFKMWLQGMGYEKSLLSMNRFDDEVPKQIVDKTISTYQIIKALNQEWMHVCLDTLCGQITNKKIAKILTESLEDYVELWNSDYEDVKKHSRVDSRSLWKLLEDFKIRLEELCVDGGKQKNMLKEKKSSASFKEYATLMERINKLQRQI